MSCSFRTWRSCQTIIVSSTVPIPPGTTTKASETSTKWCSREKNVRCSKTSLDERVDVLLERQVDPDADGGPVGARAGRAGPLVRGLHQTGPAAGDDVAAEPGQLRGQVADGRVAPVAGVDAGRAEDRHAVSRPSGRPEPRQVVDDIPEAEHGLREEPRGRLFVPEGDDVGGPIESFVGVHGRKPLFGDPTSSGPRCAHAIGSTHPLGWATWFQRPMIGSSRFLCSKARTPTLAGRQ